MPDLIKPRQVAVTEHQIQLAFINWVSVARRGDWRLQLLFAVPNGGKRSKVTAAMLKMEGALPGVCDILLPYPSAGFCGLAIEFKRPKTGRLSSHQSDYIDLLTRAGWFVVICTGALEAIDIVKNYLNKDS